LENIGLTCRPVFYHHRIFSQDHGFGAQTTLCFFLLCKAMASLFSHHSKWTCGLHTDTIRVSRESCLALSGLTYQHQERKFSTMKGRESRTAQKKMIKFEFARAILGLILKEIPGSFNHQPFHLDEESGQEFKSSRFEENMKSHCLVEQMKAGFGPCQV